MSRGQTLGLALLLLGASSPVMAVQHKAVHTKAPITHAVKPAATAKNTGAAPPKVEVTQPVDAARAAERAQQTQARQLQEDSIKAQQAQSRHAEEMQKLSLEQAKQTQEVARLEESKVREAEEADKLKRDTLRKAHQREMQELQKQADAAAEKVEEKPKTAVKPVDPAEVEFKKAHADAIQSAFSGSRKITDRDSLPAITEHPASFAKAINQAFVIRNANGEQRKQAQAFQQGLQARLIPLLQSQAPSTRADLKSKQTIAYFNSYPAFVNHETVTITKKNTFIREVPPQQYPIWYERTPGWTYCNGYVVGGSVQGGAAWLAYEWPAIYGLVPTGFFCDPEYFPTPWVYVPYCDKWRQAGELAWRSGPDGDYTGPISVESIEPITAKVPDKSGALVFQTFNVIYLYDAIYFPEFDRWGYMNKQGYFVWLNV